MTATVLPESLRKEIHPTLNDPKLDLNSLTANSKVRIWWQGGCSHVWEASVYNRSHGTGCPVCAGQQVLEGYNDFASQCPAIASQWHPVNNGELSPKKVTKGSNKTVWWLGECGHEWEAPIARRAKGSGCIYCAGKKVLAGFNDLASQNPEVASLWHPVNNNDILPTMVTPNSNKNAWWLGECGHEWEVRIADVTSGRGCPVCAGKQVLAGFNDLASVNPLLASEWHPDSNDGILPTLIAGKSGKRVWWLGKCGHEWQATVLSRHQGNGCPVCVGQVVLPGFNDLATTHPQVAGEWDAEKNADDFTPLTVTAGTHKKAWWLADCGHSWEASITNRTSKGRGCPYCANQKVMPGHNDAGTTHKKLETEWHPEKNGDLLPDMVVAGSIKSVWWLGKCGHEWQSKVFNKTNGVGCPYCGNLKIIVGFNDLGTTHPLVAKQWNTELNGDISTESVTFGSSYKAWWTCSDGHNWVAKVADRTKEKATGCPQCAAVTFVSKSEKEIADFIRSQGLTVKTTERSILPKHEIDIYLPDQKIGVEFNGLYWHSEVWKDPKYHYNKWLAAKEKGIQLIQIWEDEWKRNPEQIKAMLLHKLGVSNERRIFARKTYVELLKKNQVEGFLNRNHIQGFVAGSYYLGLLEQGTDELVSVLVLKKQNDGSGIRTLDIVRYATSATVVGGFTKLISYADKHLEFDRFITFSDHCVSDGGLYANNGFTADKELAPDYMYVVRNERKHKFGYRLKKFREDPSLLWQEGLTERELAKLNGLPRIWDAGKTRWVRNRIKR